VFHGKQPLQGRKASAGFTLCEGRLPAEYVQWALEDLGPVDGSLDGSRYHFPVVLGWETDCAGAAVDTRPPAILRELTSLDAVNQVREIDILLAAAGLNGVLLDEARAAADEARSRLEDD